MEFPSFELTVNLETIEEDSWTILTLIRPHWKRALLRVETLGGGVMNNMRKYHQDGKPEDTIIIRVYGEGKVLINRNQEFNIMGVLSSEELIPIVYCRFKNGYALKYSPGSTLTPKQLTNPHIYKKVIKKLHNIHSLDMAGLTGTTLTSAVQLVSGAKGLVKMSEEMLKQNPWLKQTFGSVEALIERVDDVVKLLASLETDFPPVFTHYDAHMLNIVYDEITDEVSILDWEAAVEGPEVMDIAAHWHADSKGQFKAAGMDMCSMTTYKRQFLKDYFTTHPKYKDTVITDDLIDRWLVGCNKAAYVQCFTYMVWALCQVDSADDFNYLEFAKQTFSTVETLKKQF